MGISGYQIEWMLYKWFQQHGYPFKETSAESVGISSEAHMDSQQASPLFLDEDRNHWISPDQVFTVIGDTSVLDSITEYEQQRRAGQFLCPVYLPENPPPVIPKVSQLKRWRRQKIDEDAPTDGEVKSIQKTQKIDFQESVIESLLSEGEPFREGSESDVVYGLGAVTDGSMKLFVKKYTDSAVKFLKQTDLGEVLSILGRKCFMPLGKNVDYRGLLLSCFLKRY